MLIPPRLARASKLACWQRALTQAWLAAGVDSGVLAAGVGSGVLATGVGVGVLAAGVAAGASVAGVAVGVGVPAALGGAGGSDGLHEEKIATAAARLSTVEDALFIG